MTQHVFASTSKYTAKLPVPTVPQPIVFIKFIHAKASAVYLARLRNVYQIAYVRTKDTRRCPCIKNIKKIVSSVPMLVNVPCLFALFRSLGGSGDRQLRPGGVIFLGRNNSRANVKSWGHDFFQVSSLPSITFYYVPLSTLHALYLQPDRGQ